MADYTKPDQDGNLPKAPIDWKINDNGTQIPKDLLCNTWYKFNVKVQRGGCNCQTINYADLYHRARAVAQSWAEQALDCKLKTNCLSLEQVMEDCGWNCNAGQAYAVVLWAGMCTSGNPLKPGPPGPPAEPEPDPNDFTKKKIENLPPAGAYTLVEVLPAGIPVPPQRLACPETKTLLYILKRAVDKCPPPTFKPFVDEAVQGARGYDMALSCTPQCGVIPKFNLLCTQWKCAGANEVEVDVYFEAVCAELPKKKRWL